jgi:hypothetical protein
MSRASSQFKAFDVLVRRVLTVPRAELQKRLDEHKRQSNENPNKRGPKRKGVTPSAEHRDDA